MPSFLDHYKRQPKIFIDLPSKGEWYDNFVVENGQFTQLPVYGLNTMDELMLKTPDALFSGEATVRVIHSCIPSIKNPWKINNIDLDALLIGIRIATHGEKLNFETTCPHCKETNKFEINLTTVLDGINSRPPIQLFLKYDKLIIKLKPLTYDSLTSYSKQILLLQKELLNTEKLNLSLNDKEKEQKKIIDTITSLNIDFNLEFIESISDTENEESDHETLKNFIKDTDLGLYEQIALKVKEINEYRSNHNYDLTCVNEMCKKSYTTNLQLDYSTFFVKK